MRQDEWEQVVNVMTALWPEHRELTPENLKLWRSLCDRFPVEWCCNAFREMKQRKRYFPHFGDVREILKAKHERHGGAQPSEASYDAKAAEQTERDRRQREWAEKRAACADLSDEEMAEHKRMLLAADRRLRWMAGLDARSGPWLVFIFDRMRRGEMPGTNPVTVWTRDGKGESVRVTDEALAEVDHLLASNPEPVRGTDLIGKAEVA